MLSEQAEITAQGVSTVRDWVQEPTAWNYDQVIALTIQADIVRLTMEEKLIDAFATPFDRQDIYYISVRMDRIIEHARFAMQSISEYKVDPDRDIVQMSQELSKGTNVFAEAIALLERDPIGARSKIHTMRHAHYTTVDHYQKSMANLFKSDDAMNALKHYEVNCQFREAAHCLSKAVDVLHRIVVRLV
jgi:uncharacterized protein Yka (UPF0111/DUF47 family)